MKNKIIAGDYEGYDIMYTFGNVMVYKNNHNFRLDKNNLQSVEIVTEENKKEIAGAAGWAIAGTVLLGPLGLIAGALIGGNKKEVTFVCNLKDGKKFLAIAESKIYTKLLAYVF